MRLLHGPESSSGKLHLSLVAWTAPRLRQGIMEIIPIPTALRRLAEIRALASCPMEHDRDRRLFEGDS